MGLPSIHAGSIRRGGGGEDIKSKDKNQPIPVAVPCAPSRGVLCFFLQPKIQQAQIACPHHPLWQVRFLPHSHPRALGPDTHWAELMQL